MLHCDAANKIGQALSMKIGYARAALDAVDNAPAAVKKAF